MKHVEIDRPAERVPVAPSLAPTLAVVDASPRFPESVATDDRRIVFISVLATLLGGTAACVSRLLTSLIAFVTNLSFYGRVSLAPVGPADHHLGAWVVAVPIVGGLIVGVMARYGSAAIRGHGIPEAMEQVLLNESRIPVRMTFLKPLSAAISIGTGGPFGAEGPIIATGGALGSLVGQIVSVSADERKILLAAGAAAGMSATFGSPVSAIMLAIELLLFEYRARSIVPVALASAAACAMRSIVVGDEPAFSLANVASSTSSALVLYVCVGAAVGLASVVVTRGVYAVEDLFEKIPRIHWMWWPAIGGLAVGLVGFVSPHTMGVGYDNIDRILAGDLVGRAALVFCLLKLVSWSLSLGSGTSGGTLAPLFTIGGGLGAVVGGLAVSLLPSAGIDVRVAALVGMAAMFAGASRALLTSILFAFETTRQPMVIVPLLAGCTVAFLVSRLLMRHTIMTEKLARRGTRVVSDYQADPLDRASVGSVLVRPTVSVRADDSLDTVRDWLRSGSIESRHRGFPVLDDKERIVGVLTRHEILTTEGTDRIVRDRIKRAPVLIADDASLSEAAQHMIEQHVSRLPVVSHNDPSRLIGMLTRGDLLAARLSDRKKTRGRGGPHVSET